MIKRIGIIFSMLFLGLLAYVYVIAPGGGDPDPPDQPDSPGGQAIDYPPNSNGDDKEDDPMEDFGKFEGRVLAEWGDDGRDMTLVEDFVYIDPKGRRWEAPAGSVVNGASIPRAFWSLIGGPFEGPYRNASVVHDVACVEQEASWQDVHRAFYDACRCGGVDKAKAKLMYYAVYNFGPRWEAVRTFMMRSGMAEEGGPREELGIRGPARAMSSPSLAGRPSMSAESIPEGLMLSVDTPEPDDELARKAAAFFQENQDISLDDIENLRLP